MNETNQSTKATGQDFTRRLKRSEPNQDWLGNPTPTSTLVRR